MGLMGYIAAGAVSGAGQAIQQGAQQTQSAFTQQMLLQERERLEAARDENMRAFHREQNELNREHQRGLQQERIGADVVLRGQELTARSEEGKAERTLRRDIADEDRKQAKAIAEMTDKRMRETSAAEISSRESTSFVESSMRESIAKEDRESHERIALQQLHDTRDKVQLVTDASGRVMKIDARGNSRGFLMVSGADGKETPFIAGKDLDARTKAQVEIMKTMIAQYGDVAERLAQVDPQEAKNYLEKAERIKANVDVLLGYSAAPGAGSTLPAYKQPFPEATPESPARESAQPAGTGSSALMNTPAPVDPAIAQAAEIRRSLPPERKTLAGRTLDAVVAESKRQLQPSGPRPITQRDVADFVKRADHPGFAEAFRRSHGRVPNRAELNEYQNSLRR